MIFAAGIAGTFAVGALLAAQFATEDSDSSPLVNLQATDGTALYC